MQAEPTDGPQPSKWSDVNWTATEAAVQRIQSRIFRATKAGDGRQVRNLQKLLVRSRSAKLLAIRQVTRQNAGRHTPGIDGVVCMTPEDWVTLLETGLDLKGYKPKPVKWVYIPKAHGKVRPLRIPTIKDRVMQAVVKLALEPNGRRASRRTAISASRPVKAGNWSVCFNISGLSAEPLPRWRSARPEPHNAPGFG